MYRQFYLKNGRDEVFELTNRSNPYFLDKPQGLGFSITPVLETYPTYRDVKGRVNNFPTITGQMTFTGDNETNYANYHQFESFCQNAPHRLFYVLPTGATYSIDVEITSLTKTENGQKGIMQCQISMSANSMWKSEEVTTTFSSYAQVSNGGDLPCGFEVEMTGNMEDPWLEVKKGDDTVGIAKFIGMYSYIYINSKDGEQDIILKEGDSVIANPFSRQDLSVSNGSIYVTFIKLVKGVNHLEVGGGVSSATVKYQEMRASV